MYVCVCMYDNKLDKKAHVQFMDANINYLNITNVNFLELTLLKTDYNCFPVKEYT